VNYAGEKPISIEAEIEGTLMKVCDGCAKYGKIKGKAFVKIVYKDTKKPEVKEQEYAYVQDYGSIVKKARERLGLKQDELAKKLNEKESLLHQIESEHFKPGLDLARKLEKQLHIKIIQEITDENILGNKSTGPMTLGDMMRKG